MAACQGPMCCICWPIPNRWCAQYGHRPVKISHTSVLVEAELLLDGIPTRVAYKRLRS